MLLLGRGLRLGLGSGIGGERAEDPIPGHAHRDGGITRRGLGGRSLRRRNRGDIGPLRGGTAASASSLDRRTRGGRGDDRCPSGGLDVAHDLADDAGRLERRGLRIGHRHLRRRDRRRWSWSGLDRGKWRIASLERPLGGRHLLVELHRRRARRALRRLRDERRIRDLRLGCAGFTRADFGRADRGRHDLARADLGRADLRRADLRRAGLRRAGLRRAGHGRADLGVRIGRGPRWFHHVGAAGDGSLARSARLLRLLVAGGHGCLRNGEAARRRCAANQVIANTPLANSAA
ncbi:MAG: pentapeptide repeat-containing protein [Myxococcales bacterium]|nr:pentapeptide repeat-containing protein [Myxococcales bacterium]